MGHLREETAAMFHPELTKARLLLLAVLLTVPAARVSAQPSSLDPDSNGAHRAPGPCFVFSETGGADDPTFENVPDVVETLPTTNLGRRLSDIRQQDVIDVSKHPLTGSSSGGYTPALKSPAPGLSLKLKSPWAQFMLVNQGTGLGEVRGELQAHTPGESQSLTFATIYSLPINGKTTADLKELDWIYQWNFSPTASLKAVHAITGLDGSSETDTYRADLLLRW